jgi:hypothetical protein
MGGALGQAGLPGEPLEELLLLRALPLPLRALLLRLPPLLPLPLQTPRRQGQGGATATLAGRATTFLAAGSCP